jgi:hypothetical protein
MIWRADLTPSRPRRICMRPMLTLVLPFPAINPVLVQWGPLAIRWYALAYIVGLVLGWRLIRHIVFDDHYWNGVKRPSGDSIDDLLVYCAFGVIIGGRLGNVLLYDPQYYFSHPIEIFKIWEGGMASARSSRRSASSSAASPISSAPNSGGAGPTSRGRLSFQERTVSRATRARFTKHCSKDCWRLSFSMRSRNWARCADRA